MIRRALPPKLTSRKTTVRLALEDAIAWRTQMLESYSDGVFAKDTPNLEKLRSRIEEYRKLLQVMK